MFCSTRSGADRKQGRHGSQLVLCLTTFPVLDLQVLSGSSRCRQSPGVGRWGGSLPTGRLSKSNCSCFPETRLGHLAARWLTQEPFHLHLTSSGFLGMEQPLAVASLAFLAAAQARLGGGCFPWLGSALSVQRSSRASTPVTMLIRQRLL